ncbi:hypothetical protein EIP91_011385 [Steccherinum ochraceum]|uniref:PIN domain-containing protein n=1 Tax=Steccherinum ochraceum TaxID=92696 RepID=A0A4R0RMG1_9APHY|nr:hypothetical protein EIP91_011385 [Steccherinum ochraceum]
MSTTYYTSQPPARPLSLTSSPSSSSSWAHAGPGSGPTTTTLPSSHSTPQLSTAAFEWQDDTLLHIAEEANLDVEMRDAFPVGSIYIVIDTNVLIDQLAVIKRLSEDVEAHDVPIVIVIPNVVLTELDGLKNRDGLKWFAQTASTYLLRKVKERKSVKVQARVETLHIEAQASDGIRKNDIRIFDCCCYFRTKGEVILASGDKNLCIECEKEHIRTISPPPKRSWTSRDIAHALVAYDIYGIHTEHFHGHEDASYRPAPEASTHTRLTEGSVWQPDEDSMDVDDEFVEARPPVEDFIPSHALDALHWQVIDQFFLVLRDLADRLRKVNGHTGPPIASLHAPWYRRVPFQQWTVENCLEYFDYHLQQKNQRKLKATNPPLPVFLQRSHESFHGRRGRRGQDWSRQDWLNITSGLQEIGQRLEDGPVYVSVRALQLETEVVFQTPMRPTGT